MRTPCIKLTFALAACVACLTPAPSLAQDANGTPTFGSATLASPLKTDAFMKQVAAGGAIKTKLGGVGAFVSSPPDFRLNYAAAKNTDLVIRAVSSFDTTLLINLPDGTWVANDDSGSSRNPMIRLTNPKSGRYDIFLGTFAKVPRVGARLEIRDLPTAVAVPVPEPVKVGPAPIEMPQGHLKPRFGSVSLKFGFTPDPFVTTLSAGGPLKTRLGGHTAYVTKEPSFRLSYSKNNSAKVGLPLRFSVQANVDTTLLIRRPTGEWVANNNDSHGTLNPEIFIPSAGSGSYDIYVGTFGATGTPARLLISER